MVEMKLLTVDFSCDSSPTRSFSLPGVWWWCGAQGYCFAVTRQRNFWLESVGQPHLNIDQWSSMYGTFFRLRFSFRGDQRWPRKRTNLRNPKRKQWLNMDPEYFWLNHILAWKTDIFCFGKKDYWVCVLDVSLNPHSFVSFWYVGSIRINCIANSLNRACVRRLMRALKSLRAIRMMRSFRLFRGLRLLAPWRFVAPPLASVETAESWINPDLISDWWFGTWFLFFHILGISSSQLTNLFQRGRSTTNQRLFGCLKLK